MQPKRRRIIPERVSYRPLLVGAYEYYQKEMLSSLVSLKPKTHYEAVTNQVKTKQKNYGDVRLSNIRIFLDHVKGYDRSEMQKTISRVFFTGGGSSFVQGRPRSRYGQDMCYE